MRAIPSTQSEFPQASQLPSGSSGGTTFHDDYDDVDDLFTDDLDDELDDLYTDDELDDYGSDDDWAAGPPLPTIVEALVMAAEGSHRASLGRADARYARRAPGHCVGSAIADATPDPDAASDPIGALVRTIAGIIVAMRAALAALLSGPDACLTSPADEPVASSEASATGPPGARCSSSARPPRPPRRCLAARCASSKGDGHVAGPHSHQVLVRA